MIVENKLWKETAGRTESNSGHSTEPPGSSGLGLAIAKAIVELHGGSISADNNAGQGTTIKFKFPI